MGVGNYNALLFNGHVNGGITDTLSGRLSFQYRKHDGYAEDVLHHRDVEDLDSTQLRAQLLWEPGDGWRIRGIFDYTDDDSNGMNAVAVEGGTKCCETSYLRTNCTRPWSNLRAYLGLTDPRQSMPQSVQFKDLPRQQQYPVPLRSRRDTRHRQGVDLGDLQLADGLSLDRHQPAV